MLIPYDRLSPEALRGLVEDFITREGTDYGAVEQSLDQKVAQVMRQLQRGEVVVAFDPDSQTCNLCTARGAAEHAASREGEVVYDDPPWSDRVDPNRDEAPEWDEAPVWEDGPDWDAP